MAISMLPHSGLTAHLAFRHAQKNVVEMHMR